MLFSLQQFIKTCIVISGWCLKMHPKVVLFYIQQKHTLTKNAKLHNRHHGERCFILANGPSVKTQDIKGLKNETVFSVSSGYKHEDFSLIAPRYHVIPQVSYNFSADRNRHDVVTDWFIEMHANLGSAELFLSTDEYNLIKKRSLFAGRRLHFLALGKRWASSARPDLTSLIMRPQSAPVMAISIALYMGFKEIYLLGTDHDWFVKKEYTHSFKDNFFKGLDKGVTSDGTITVTLLEYLPMIKLLWSQYRALRIAASKQGATIYNATNGGMLDEFERVRFEDIPL